MNATELKYLYLDNDPDGYFFSRKAMRFFGDTMRNYGATETTVWHRDKRVECLELFRKRPVKHGLKSSAYFSFDGKQLLGAKPLASGSMEAK